MEEINYITPKDSFFYKSNGGFLGLKIDENDYKRVSILKAFPFSYSNNFYSVRDKDNNEIGIIKEINEYPEDAILLITEELQRRYFMPVINKIQSIKDEYGYSYWDVETNIGNKNFIIRKDNKSFVNVRDHMILIIDVDGNRFEISDYKKLDKKSLQLIDLML